MVSTPVFSIIVPVYNSEKYIEQCLRSLIEQTFKNIEIIVIDDGSTDSSGLIIKKLAETDSRISYYKQANAGVSVARNYGVKLAIAPYIMFVDSDDFLEGNACEVLYNACLENDIECIIFNCSLFYGDCDYVKRSLGSEKKRFSFENCSDNYLYRRCFGLCNEELNKIEELDYLSSVCLKVYRNDIIKNHNIKFPDINTIGSYEDGIFNLNYFYYINNGLYLPNALYHYRRDNEDSNTSVYKPDLDKKWAKLFLYLQDEINNKELGGIFQEALDNRICLSIIGLGLNCVQDRKLSFKQKLIDVYNVLNDPNYRQKIKKISLSNMRFIWKIFFLFVKLRFSITVTMMLFAMNYLRRL